MVDKIKKEPVEVFLLSNEFCLYSQSMILLTNLKGGKRIEAAQWSLEIQKMLRGIVESGVALETSMRQAEGNKKLYLEDDEVVISNEKRHWAAIYLVDNATFRISACLDKISQMCRCYFEDPENGGILEFTKPCKCKDSLNESNCSFGNLLAALYADPSRNQEIFASLKELNSDSKIQEFKKNRNAFTHRKHLFDSTKGLDPKVSVEFEGATSKATLKFGESLPSFDYFRRGIFESNNKIVKCVEEVGRIIFPRDFKMTLKKADGRNQKTEYYAL